MIAMHRGEGSTRQSRDLTRSGRDFLTVTRVLCTRVVLSEGRWQRSGRGQACCRWPRSGWVCLTLHVARAITAMPMMTLVQSHAPSVVKPYIQGEIAVQKPRTMLKPLGPVPLCG
jgi:hypothetical protein